MALNRKAAEEFARYWAGRGDEKGETQQFWIDLLQNVLGDDDALRHLHFEARVDTEAGSSKGFADVTVMRADGRGALAMVEQKSADVDLDKPEMRQGRMVTPVQQCRAHAEALPFNEQPRWVLTCNFKVIRVYVACWYKKASDYIKGLPTRCALVSTNSICQGQQVEPLWRPLFENGVHIDFAHRTFVWNSEATDEAHVHVVIVGFSRADAEPKLLFDEGDRQEVDHINAYLAPVPDAFIAKRNFPLCNVLPMVRGCQPTDDGALLLTQDERDELLKREPVAEPCVIHQAVLNGGRIHKRHSPLLPLDGRRGSRSTAQAAARSRARRARA